MKRVEVLEEIFELSDECETRFQNIESAVKTDDILKRMDTTLLLLIDKKEAYRVYDRFEEEDITVLENGDFLVKARYLVDDWVYGMILSFGPSAKVLEPEFVKEEIKNRLEMMREMYKLEKNEARDME